MQLLSCQELSKKWGVGVLWQLQPKISAVLDAAALCGFAYSLRLV